VGEKPGEWTGKVTEIKSEQDANLTVRCIVELFGAARLVAKTREIALQLPSPVSLGDIYYAVSREHPALLGRVIAADGSSLTPGYACNINGVDFVRGNNAQVNSGDRVFIISADAGG
jgi:molybdopterin converting factor small subunit